MTTTVGAEVDNDSQMAGPPPQSLIGRLRLDRFSAVYLLGAFFIFFGLTESSFLQWNGSIEFVLTEKVIVSMLALAFLVPLTTMTFDLSIGASMALCLVIVNKMALETDLPDGLGAILGLAACAAVGAVNGFVVTRLKVNSFIATLGMSTVIASLIRGIHGGGQITNAFGEAYINFGKGDIFSFNWPGTGSEISLPWYFLYGLIVAFIVWYILEHTALGRHMFATGGNPEAARLSGIKTDRMAFGSLVASALISGFAGLVYSWKFGTFSNSVGPPLLFVAVAAVFFGASQLKSRPNVWGTLLAVYTLGFGIKGIGLRYPRDIDWIQPLFEGLTLIVAVAIASRQAVITVNKRRGKDQPPDDDGPADDPSPNGSSPTTEANVPIAGN